MVHEARLVGRAGQIRQVEGLVDLAQRHVDGHVGDALHGVLEQRQGLLPLAATPERARERQDRGHVVLLGLEGLAVALRRELQGLLDPVLGAPDLVLEARAEAHEGVVAAGLLLRDLASPLAVEVLDGPGELDVGEVLPGLVSAADRPAGPRVLEDPPEVLVIAEDRVLPPLAVAAVPDLAPDLLAAGVGERVVEVGPLLGRDVLAGADLRGLLELVQVHRARSRPRPRSSSPSTGALSCATSARRSPSSWP